MTMIAQRPTGSAPIIQGTAEQLPLPSASFDAAMALLTVHHWADLDAGPRELRRVATRIAVFTFDATVGHRAGGQGYPGSPHSKPYCSFQGGSDLVNVIRQSTLHLWVGRVI